ncbi:MAG: hypothetical protein ACE5ID_04340 [Acidobacteriota bacterium]
MATRFAAVLAALAGCGWLLFSLLVGAGSTPAYAAMLQPVFNATGQAGAVHVVLRMLARQGEDFPYVDLDGELSDVEAWIQMPDDGGRPARARIDRPDRVRSFDGRQVTEYHPASNEAFRGEAGSMDISLFWPAAWVEQILNTPTAGVEIVSYHESGGTGRLVLRQQGAPTGPRAPAFLGEFDRETEVEWDLATHRLTGLRRWVDVNGQRRLFSQAISIEYLPSIDDGVFHLELPSGVRWGGVKEAPMAFLELGPRSAALALFHAAREGDRETLELLCPSPATVDFLLDPRHRPDKLLFLGDPFRSGNYPGVYVPYKVSFPGGIKKHNLALRNDNPQRRWVFDGGI